MKLVLETDDREFVHSTAWPQDERLPEIIRWNTRHFVRDHATPNNDNAVYLEAAIVALPYKEKMR